MELGPPKDMTKKVVTHSNRAVSDDVNRESSAGADSRSAYSVAESRKSLRSWSGSNRLVIMQPYFTYRQWGIALNLALFATITSAQFGAAFLADSLSLLGDCGSMAADTLSYGASLWAECTDSEHQQRNQLAATGLSIMILLGITGSVIYHACQILFSDVKDDGEVNFYVVFAFALIGLIFDLLGLYVLVQGRKEKSTNSGDLNLQAAAIHVIADLMRSTTTLVESILIWFFNFDSTTTDAWAALIVSALIVLTCFEMLREFVLGLIDYRYCYLKLIKDASINMAPGANFFDDYNTIKM